MSFTTYKDMILVLYLLSAAAIPFGILVTVAGLAQRKTRRRSRRIVIGPLMTVAGLLGFFTTGAIGASMG